MFQRAISLLVAAMLPFQGMCFAHSHVGTELPGHAGQTPHFHLFGIAAHHHVQEDCADESEDDDDDAPIQHEDDAVYVSALLMLGWHCRPSSSDLDGLSWQAPVTATVFASHVFTALLLPPTHPPPFYQPCSIYLWTLTLLI